MLAGDLPGVLTQGFADPELALSEWNRRAQMPPANPVKFGHVSGFTKKSLIRGEMVWMELDRTGALTSDQIAFCPESRELMWKPLIPIE